MWSIFFPLPDMATETIIRQIRFNLNPEFYLLYQDLSHGATYDMVKNYFYLCAAG